MRRWFFIINIWIILFKLDGYECQSISCYFQNTFYSLQGPPSSASEWEKHTIYNVMIYGIYFYIIIIIFHSKLCLMYIGKKINSVFFPFFCNFFLLVKNCIYLFLLLFFSFLPTTPNFETQYQNLGMKISLFIFLITLATWQHIIIFIFHYLHIFFSITFFYLFLHISLCE